MKERFAIGEVPPLDETELDLFRQAVRDVARLPESGRIEPVSERPAPIAYQRLRDEEQVLAESLAGGPWETLVEADGDLSFVRPGLSRQVLRKLRRGHWVVQDQLDLHGLNREAARAQTAEFLKACQRRGLRCVRIIHGKGLRSKNGEPVLKIKVRHWLMQREEVLAFSPAHPADGGTGAMLVLLKAENRKG
ncbi:MAG: Smr/MutS family protein [Pseudomonadota bacterium]